MSETKRVIIDAGHGGSDPGAVFEGRQEKDDALRLALAVGRILEDNGVEVMYTRVTDVFDSPLEKAQIANRSGADYLISIHRNAMPIPGTASGIMSLVYEKGGTAELLGSNINRQLAGVGFEDLGVIERIIPEEEPACEENLPVIAEEMKKAMVEFFRTFDGMTGEDLASQRYERFRRM